MERQQRINEFFTNFIRCGIAGWCMEIMFTALDSVMNGDLLFMGRTSLLMFPIYGFGALLAPLCRQLDFWLGDAAVLTVRDRIWRHGINNMILIFVMEYLSGSLLRTAGICPWNYAGHYFSVDGLIRLDFAPCWFAAGLIFEKISSGGKVSV